MISTNTTQIKLNIPVSLKEQVEEIAKSFGYTVSAYIRHLVLSDVVERKYPVYRASERTEKIANKAIKENKWIEVKDLDEYFKTLEQKK